MLASAWRRLAVADPSKTGSRRVAFVVMCAGYFLVLLDVTIVNVALPQMGSALRAGVSGLQWVVDGYAIALAALMLGGGTVGDRHGHKRIVLCGFALFGLGSAGSGAASTTGMLVAFRVLQGVGAALMLPGTLAVIANLYPRGDAQARAIGIWAGIGSAALAVGPLLGGALTTAVSWRAVFLVNIPIVTLAVVLAAGAAPESAGSQRRRVDRPGIALGALLLSLVTFAFIQAGHGGVGVAVVLALIAAGASAAAFLAVERARADAMLPPALLRRPAFAAANAIAGTMNFATLGLLFVLTLYLQDVRHDSALRAGVSLLPLFLPLSLIAPLGGRITARTGPRWPMLSGLLLAACGVALLLLVGAATSYLILLPALLLWGIGLSMLTPAVVAAAMAAVPGSRPGLASGVNNTARQSAGAIGIAAFGAIAGAPTGPTFLSGLHTCALIAGGLLAAGGIITAFLIPGRS